MLRLKTKDDIEFHSDGKPAVNVKVYDSLSNGYKKWREDETDDPEFTLEWIEENVPDEQGDLFWHICEIRWEDLEWEAREIWGNQQYGSLNKHAINVYSEGRSGGWAVVDGIDTDVESWDAIEFSKWKRFAKFARATADYIMVDVVDSIYHNYYLVKKEEEYDKWLHTEPNFPEGIVR